MSVQFDGHSQTLDAIAKMHTAAAAAARYARKKQL